MVHKGINLGRAARRPCLIVLSVTKLYGSNSGSFLFITFTGLPVILARQQIVSHSYIHVYHLGLIGPVEFALASFPGSGLGTRLSFHVLTTH